MNEQEINIVETKIDRNECDGQVELQVSQPSFFLDKLFFEDCRETMNKIPKECIDLVVTSPPYNIGIKYDELVQDNLTIDKYLIFTEEYLRGIYKILKQDGRLCLNIGYKVSTIINEGIDYVKLLNIAQSIGFRLRETIIWVKTRQRDNPQNFCGANTAWGSWLSPSNPICRARMEFIFVFEKKYSTKQNKGVSDLTPEEFMEYSTNVWYFPAEINRFHKAPFPIELPKRCIKLYSYLEEIIYDPFAGSGTTLKAAELLKRKWCGSEIIKKYIDYSENRLSDFFRRSG